MSFWPTFLGVATAVAQVVLNLSPVPDITRVHRRQRIGELVALLLITMVVNCHFWLVYAYVTGSMFPLFATQIFGQLVAIVYTIYYRWSDPEKRKELRKLYAWALAAHCALSLYTILGLLGATDQSDSEVDTYLGYVGIIIDVWMFASPLGTLKHELETKSAASIPINLSLMLFVSTTLWVVSGMVDRDYFVAGLNSIGSLLSVVQIVFYMIYRPPGDEDLIPYEAAELADEVSVLEVTPTAETKSEAVSIHSAAYKMMLSPTAHRN
ncbi:hypothetical protein PHYPSEUDO_003311 [Phytophthora pseudosyringae]|uniref:Sugar transporter SWEET1 n=1 Tax=Phytophthora pseudosyringae TaxID=221518 RepID=A0A8T1VUR6_9STRA|nr:hypothetical protein PHYPSEUDO_003311 [Phytophthora pseudosyringae]